MAAVGGHVMNGSSCFSSSVSSYENLKRFDKKMINTRFRVSCCIHSRNDDDDVVSDPYKTLRIQPGASESEIKKAFRQLALKYHPDVCKGNDCGIQFQQINEAYDIVMSTLRGETSTNEIEDGPLDDTMRGMDDQDWDLWEEWMGWEGAGIRDYSSHINPYI